MMIWSSAFSVRVCVCVCVRVCGALPLKPLGVCFRFDVLADRKEEIKNKAEEIKNKAAA